MTAADFRRDVERELEHLRRAHVVTNVEIGTDMLVGVSLSLDGKPHDMTVHVTNASERQAAFVTSLAVVRSFRDRMMPIPERRRENTRRIRIPLERHVAEPSWPALAFFALCFALLIALSWLLDVDVFGTVSREESSGRQRRPRVGAGTTAGNPTAKRAGSVGDDPGEFVDRVGCRSLVTRTCGAGRSRTI